MLIFDWIKFPLSTIANHFEMMCQSNTNNPIDANYAFDYPYFPPQRIKKYALLHRDIAHFQK